MEEPIQFREIEATLSFLRELVTEELARACRQTERLAALDADASSAYAQARSAFNITLNDGHARLAEQVADACRELGLSSFEPNEIERRHPGAGRRLTQALRALAEAASLLRRQDALNVQLATRARACVGAWLRALTGSPIAYNRYGAARELSAFSTALKVA